MQLQLDTQNAMFFSGCAGNSLLFCGLMTQVGKHEKDLMIYCQWACSYIKSRSLCFLPVAEWFCFALENQTSGTLLAQISSMSCF